MEAFFQSTLWIVISAGISVLGLVGTILGIYQYLKSSKELKEYKYLFKVAGQHVDLEDKKNQIDNYENQIVHMQKTLNEQIPTEAKKIALRGILDSELQVLSTTYTKVKSLQAELEVLTPENVDETEELMKNVNKIIEPAYSRKRLDNLLSTIFYLVSIVSSFLSMILPYRVYQMVIVIILLFQLIVGVRTTINIVKLNYTRKEMVYIMKKMLLIGSIISLLVSLLTMVVFILLSIDSWYHVNEGGFFVLAITFFILHLFLGFLFFHNGAKKSLIIWLILSFICLIITSVCAISLPPRFIFIGISVAVINIIYLFICLLKK